MYKIPLSNYPNQNFECTVPINGENKRLKFELWYNYQAQYWLVSLFDLDTNLYLVSNLPLLVSYGDYSNMLFQLGYLKIGVCFTIPMDINDTANPNDENLGTNYAMIWGDNDG